MNLDIRTKSDDNGLSNENILCTPRYPGTIVSFTIITASRYLHALSNKFTGLHYKPYTAITSLHIVK